ncbi:MAG: hypothetical protein WDA72_10050 [Desulfomonilia bacterium]|jgi:hypothetical protein|nr:hypothetical protein [Deltaproteobacteria bacterium]
MNVEEKDRVVHGMLEDEYQRCQDVLHSLQEKIKLFPKGALNVRKKKYKGKEYSYHYLISREGGKIVNRHIPEENLSQLSNQLKERDLCKKEIQSYKKRIAYLERLLKTSKSK